MSDEVEPTIQPNSATKRRTPTAEVRDIIWRAHNKKCALTGEPISYAELHVDHIIPLDGGDAILADLQKRGMVDSDFDLNGTENLIPTKSNRNRQKGRTPLSEAATIYYLEIAQQKKEAIDSAVASETSNARYWSNLLNASVDMGKNGYEPEEYFTILRNQETDAASIRFPLDISGEQIRTANSVVAAQLMDMPFSLAGGAFNTATGENENGEVGAFSTPREFAAGMAEGYAPMTTFEMNVWGAAERTTLSLLALQTSRFAPKSAIRFPRITLRNSDKWSSRWITGWTYPDSEVDVESLTAQYPTIASLVASGIARQDAVDDPDWVASFHWAHGFSVKLFELLRTDLDNDSEEEILLSCVGWASTGSLRMPTIRVGKPDETGLIIPSEYAPLLDGGGSE